MRSAEEIIERLKKSFYTPSKKDEKLKVVGLCIVISTTFWFFSALNKDDYISQINYPIEIEFDMDEYIAIGDLPSRIPLEVTGGGWDLMTRSFGFNMSPIKISLERPDASGFIMTSSLRAQLTPGLDPVAINYVLLDSLRFDIQRKVSRTFKLSLNPTSISLDDNYRIASAIRVEPDTVVWTGPEQMINSLGNVIYLDADMTDIDRDIDEVVDIPEPPNLFSAQAKSVRLRFQVVRMLEVFDNVKVSLLNLPDTLWVSDLDSVSVRYRIAEDAFDVLDSGRVDIIADYNYLNPQDSTISLIYRINNQAVEELEFSPLRVKFSRNE